MSLLAFSIRKIDSTHLGRLLGIFPTGLKLLTGSCDLIAARYRQMHMTIKPKTPLPTSNHRSQVRPLFSHNHTSTTKRTCPQHPHPRPPQPPYSPCSTLPSSAIPSPTGTNTPNPAPSPSHPSSRTLTLKPIHTNVLIKRSASNVMRYSRRYSRS